jgi:hypothetical protein
MCLGRFMSEDPKGFDAGDYNLFRYCGNDPEDRTDPTGLQAPNEAPYDTTYTTRREAITIAWTETGSHIPGHITFVLEPISGDRNIHVDRIRDASGHVTKDIARTDASLTIRPVEASRNASQIVASTKVDVLYADKVKPDARDFARLKEPDHYNEIKQKFYDVATTRVEALNDHASSFTSVAAGLKTMESQLRGLFNTVVKESIQAHDNYDGVHTQCDHCYQGDPFTR